MLARVAESIYWMARYCERAEDLARLINVNSHLLLDLPRGIAPGWRPLIDITGSGELYAARYPDYQEANVLHFLMCEPQSPSSILNSLNAARENARTVRSGMYADAEILVTERDGLAVPVSAVGSTADGAIVRKVNAEGVVSEVAVKTGIRDGAWVEILEGLAEGDQIVTKAGAFVRDGDHINPVLTATQ